MKKLLLILIILTATSILLTGSASASGKKDGLDDNISEQLEFLDTEKLEEYLEGLNDSQKELFGDSSFKDKVKSILTGDFKIGYASFFDAVFNLFFDDILNYLPVFTSVAAICILCGIVSQMKSTFMSESTSGLIFFVSYCSVILLILSSVFSLFQTVYESIN